MRTQKNTVVGVKVSAHSENRPGTMTVLFADSHSINRKLSRSGKYRFESGGWYATCVPTVESVQKAISYVYE